MMASSRANLEFLKRYFARDVFAQSCGIELVEASNGTATAVVRIEERHLNGIGIVHGGLLFTLADMAFAAAAHTRGHVSVSVSSTISYIKAGRGKTLLAKAREIARNRRLATYAVDLVDETGEVIAAFQGLAYVKNDPLPDLGE
ncbi:MAG TPA: PaaI family thioesterase [Deltaproteobacteria bacterium]|nr:PaaI family thioesterase [Deltaproteobacteria bacterium]HPA84762.1 PaaI family thioesterase [Deltaproteobacteria bacterium]HQO80518.1 PaaI family thioesterase [Deltaproteobacteria bacterium]HQQ14689.1 PaaI family thioesterase [Deltaproteobacteria bacterium]